MFWNEWHSNVTCPHSWAFTIIVNLCCEFFNFLLPPARRSQMPCVTTGIQISALIATHTEVLGGWECIPDPVAKLSLCGAYSSGVRNVWQMGKYVFLWRLPGPLHLNQLFCILHDLWIEFSACLERVALSDLASRTYALIAANVATNVATVMRQFQN